MSLFHDEQIPIIYLCSSTFRFGYNLTNELKKIYNS